MPDDHRP